MNGLNGKLGGKSDWNAHANSLETQESDCRNESTGGMKGNSLSYDCIALSDNKNERIELEFHGCGAKYFPLL